MADGLGTHQGYSKQCSQFNSPHHRIFLSDSYSELRGVDWSVICLPVDSVAVARNCQSHYNTTEVFDNTAVSQTS